IRPESGGVVAPPVVRVSRDQDLPLSFAQERLWFIDQLAPGSPLYNVPAAFRFTGALDLPALAASLLEITQRHEALRTVFLNAGGRPRQVILPEAVVALPVIDLSILPETARETEGARLAAEEAARPFDLACGPLARMVLIRLQPDEHIAVLNLHHIISDQWSIAVFVRELCA